MKFPITKEEFVAFLKANRDRVFYQGNCEL